MTKSAGRDKGLSKSRVEQKPRDRLRFTKNNPMNAQVLRNKAIILVEAEERLPPASLEELHRRAATRAARAGGRGARWGDGRAWSP